MNTPARILAIPEKSAARPPKPKKEETTARRKKMIMYLNTLLSLS
jgi:hypothetical protein